MSLGPTCPNCGRVNRPGARMCAGCGKPLGTPVPPPPPPRQQPRAPAQPARRYKLRPLHFAVAGTGMGLLCVWCGLIAGGIVLGNLTALTPTATLIALVTITPLPVATLAPPTSAPIPTITPFLPTITRAPATPSIVASPTIGVMPTPTSTVTPLADTPAGATLNPGETWVQNKMSLALQNQKFAGVACGGFFEFDLSLENQEASEVVVTWRGEDVTIKDDRDRAYEAFFQPAPRAVDCAKYVPLRGLIVSALGAKQNAKINIQIRGPFDEKITKLIVNAAKAGRVQNAKWEIPIPR